MSDIPEKVRKEVLKRDRYRCRKCGKEDSLSLHHVVPRSQGGDHSKENLVTVDWDCHMLIEDGALAVKFINGNWYFSKC